MYKIIVGGKIHQSGINLLEKVDNFEVIILPDASQETLENNISDADGVLLRLQSFTKLMIDNSPKLKILSRNGVGYDRIDIPELTNRKIPLTIVGDVNSGSVAEHTIMFILDLLKNSKRHDAMVRGDKWKDRDLLISNDFARKKICSAISSELTIKECIEEVFGVKNENIIFAMFCQILCFS